MNRRLVGALVLLLAVIALACKDPGANGGSGAGSGGRTTKPPATGHRDLPSSMAALGDSITAGFGACFVPTDCPRNSWATGDGTLVDSHYRRILAGNPAIKGHAHNHAVNGALAAGLAAQAARAVADRADYVTILIGANDACQASVADMTSPATFSTEIKTALTVLKVGLPKARLLMVSIPDVYRVWQVAHTNRAARQVWGLGVCPSLLANPTSTAAADVARRQRVRARIDAYDTALVQDCQWYGARCRTDEGAVHRYAFGIPQLSALDFFHPNATGQNELARVTWPGSFTWGG